MPSAFSALPFFVLLALGVVLRVAASRFEARHLHYAWDFLCRPTDGDGRDVRSLVIERTGVALGAAKLARLVSIMLIAPCLYLILQQYAPSADLSLSVLSPFANQLLRLFLTAVVIAVLFLSLSSLFMRGFYEERRVSTRSTVPGWLVNEAEAVPAPLAATALLWDWLARSGESLSRTVGFVRPKAYLFEQDNELLMAIGAVEMEAIGETKGTHRATVTADQRTEQEMIRSIQRLDETLVREVMRPINNVTAVALTNLTVEKFLALARRTGYTRFPCYYDQITNLVGFLNVHDFIDRPATTPEIPKMVRPVLFLPEIARVDLALQEMLRTKSQIAVCYDEFGGCSGLLSREDIIEEITGEIMDEYDRPESKIQTARGDFYVNGSMDLDDLREAIGLELEKKHCDTIAGYIYQRLSRTPKRGESIEEQGWRIEVLQLENHRIRRVRLTPPNNQSSGGEGGE
jgi:Mg2+/Co2+ transporter CorC